MSIFMTNTTTCIANVTQQHRFWLYCIVHGHVLLFFIYLIKLNLSFVNTLPCVYDVTVYKQCICCVFFSVSVFIVTEQTILPYTLLVGLIS